MSPTRGRKERKGRRGKQETGDPAAESSRGDLGALVRPSWGRLSPSRGSRVYFKVINILSFLHYACRCHAFSSPLPIWRAWILFVWVSHVYRISLQFPAPETSQVLWPLLLSPFPMTFPDAKDSLPRLAVCVQLRIVAPSALLLDLPWWLSW